MIGRLSERLAILHGYHIGYLILALWTLYCMLRHTRVLVGIHGVRRPWSSSVSHCDWFVLYGVDQTLSRRGRAGGAPDVIAESGHIDRSAILRPPPYSKT